VFPEFADFAIGRTGRFSHVSVNFFEEVPERGHVEFNGQATKLVEKIETVASKFYGA